LKTEPITTQVFFPSGSGQANIDEDVLTCETAFDCFDAVAELSCDWYPAAGALGCEETEQTCLINSINGVAPSGFNEYWQFEVNGVMAETGVSCFRPAPGDVLSIRIAEFDWGDFS
ncbi:MAG: DUF4430 domain-containing protein, partial [Candidatus Micrarchaeota archaeon]